MDLTIYVTVASRCRITNNLGVNRSKGKKTGSATTNPIHITLFKIRLSITFVKGDRHLPQQAPVLNKHTLFFDVQGEFFPREVDFLALVDDFVDMHEEREVFQFNDVSFCQFAYGTGSSC